MNDTSFIGSLNELSKDSSVLEIKRNQLIEKALMSDDIEEIYAAKQYLASIDKREESLGRSILVDPLWTSVNPGYREKQAGMSFEMLKAVSRVNMLQVIFLTRKNQVGAFYVPQENKYTTGFYIRKNPRKLGSKDSQRNTDAKIDTLTEYMINCGTTANKWGGDTFETFGKKLTGDSLPYDQATYEIVRNKMGIPVEFLATDATTYAIAKTYDEFPDENNPRAINGYLPSFVQLDQGVIINDFYPWELCFGVRNPLTDITRNGYGRSELEDMIELVTNMINADRYNSNYFKHGSNPRGLIAYKGNVNQTTLDDFRDYWQKTVSGVRNHHRLPIVNGDKIEWINTHQTNRDMEYSHYQEFMIKLMCAFYTIDPSEINFPMSGSSDSKPMFESNGEARLKYSRDKGLRPILKAQAAWHNKYLISELDDSFEFVFGGIDDDVNDLELDSHIKELQNFMTLDEIREKRGLKSIGGTLGRSIFNPIAFQIKSQEDMQNQQQMGGTDQQDPSQSSQEEPENPFMKGFDESISRFLNL